MMMSEPSPNPVPGVGHFNRTLLGHFWRAAKPAAVRTAQILEFYRLRWQIELVFKRMKSILGVGHLPKKDPLSAQAWLEGKLFVGLLIERMIHTAEAISPWGYTLAASPQPLARG
jgi:hypothetical protein